MPPVFGPRSPSSSRLWSRAGGSATSPPLPSRQRDHARLRAGEPLLDDDPGGAGREEPVDRGDGLVRARRDDDALAGREAVGLDDDAATAAGGLVAGVRRGRGRVVERRRAGHRDARRLGDLAAERLRALDPRRGGRGPEHEDPGVGERVRDAGGQRRLRTDDDELDRALPGDLDDRPRVERVDARETDPRLARDRVGPGRDDDLVHARLRGELPGERVLAAAAADDQDPGRHDGDGHR